MGIFNNWKLIINLRFELPSCSKLSNNLPNFDANFISLLFYIFLIAFVFKGLWFKNQHKIIHFNYPVVQYSSLSLLPICGKILERLMFNEMFDFFIKNKLIISSNQSGFKLGYSFINQLLSIIHEIHESFDVGLKVRSVFLDISKAFDKVWHDGIIYKLTQNRMSGNLLNLLEDFLKERKQHIVLNRQVSAWKNINTRATQGSILCFWLSKMVSLKISKTLGLLWKLHNLLPRSALITIYEAFVRPYLDYGDILYDQAYNMSFHHKLESIQYNACLAITGAIRGTSKEKLYQELGLESLQLRCWHRKLRML